MISKAPMKYGGIAAKLVGYNQAMYKNPVTTPIIGVGKQYDLLVTLKSVVNTADYKEFKTKFDIVNTAFRELNKEAFNEFLLYRYDNLWKWSKKDLTMLQHVIMVIVNLCNGSTRSKNLKKIDLGKALDGDTTGLTTTAISNINKYYVK
jgi:hypothetical protein